MAMRAPGWMALDRPGTSGGLCILVSLDCFSKAGVEGSALFLFNALVFRRRWAV